MESSRPWPEELIDRSGNGGGGDGDSLSQMGDGNLDGFKIFILPNSFNFYLLILLHSAIFT